MTLNEYTLYNFIVASDLILDDSVEEVANNLDTCYIQGMQLLLVNTNIIKTKPTQISEAELKVLIEIACRIAEKVPVLNPRLLVNIFIRNNHHKLNLTGIDSVLTSNPELTSLLIQLNNLNIKHNSLIATPKFVETYLNILLASDFLYSLLQLSEVTVDLPLEDFLLIKILEKYKLNTSDCNFVLQNITTTPIIDLINNVRPPQKKKRTTAFF